MKATDKIPPGPAKCLLILGMHRSGTSAFTRVLNLLGARLPSTLLPAAHGNSEGHWEPKRIVDLNEKILAELGTRWDDWSRLQPESWPENRFVSYVDQIADVIKAEYTVDGSAAFALKDPRICRMLPLYVAALNQIGASVLPILVFRHPVESIQSLARRDGKDANECALLWLRHLLESEVQTRSMDRTFADFSDLIDYPVLTTLELISKTNLSPGNLDRVFDILAFVRPELKTKPQVISDSNISPALLKLAMATYEIHRALRKDPGEKTHLDKLDILRDEFEERAREYQFSF